MQASRVQAGSSDYSYSQYYKNKKTESNSFFVDKTASVFFSSILAQGHPYYNLFLSKLIQAKPSQANHNKMLRNDLCAFYYD